MTFSVIAPPGDEQKLRDVGLEIVQAGKRLGFTMNPEGFLMAWVGESMRVLVDRDEKGEIVGILMLACGQRWLHNDFTASVLGVQGRDEDGLIDYAKNIAAAIGAIALCGQLARCAGDEAVERSARDYRRYFVMGWLLILGGFACGWLQFSRPFLIGLGSCASFLGFALVCAITLLALMLPQRLMTSIEKYRERATNASGGSPPAEDAEPAAPRE